MERMETRTSKVLPEVVPKICAAFSRERTALQMNESALLVTILVEILLLAFAVLETDHDDQLQPCDRHGDTNCGICVESGCDY